MLDKFKIRKYLNVIRHATSLIEAELDNEGDIDEILKEEIKIGKKPVYTKVPSIADSVVVPEVIAESIPEVNEQEKLRKKHIKDLLAIESWPKAVPDSHTVTPTVKDQKTRAAAVLDMILDRSIEGLKFLDFGCGEGWVAQEAKKRGADSVFGYDVELNENWKDISGCRFIHTLGPLSEKHFDIVLLFDVLDHCYDVEEVMSNVLRTVKEDGIVYVRCHPWTSKHATHLYKQGINKAYMHLFLTWQEIKDQIGKDPMFTRPEQNPLEAYRWWFKDFKILKERIDKKPVDEFFKNPDFKTLLGNEQNLTNVDHFLYLMEMQFVDYVLTPK